MSNKKQSSLEWYIEENFKLSCKLENQEITLAEYCTAYNKLLEQAKAMHKAEIIRAHFTAQPFSATMLHNAEQYYNEIFGGDNE